MTILEAVAVVEHAAASELEAVYMANGCGQCPVCLSSEIEGDGSINADDDYAWRKIKCNDCRSTWDEVFNVVGIDNLKVGSSELPKEGTNE